MEGGNTPEKYDAKEAFLKYQREQEEAGIPIDKQAVEAGEREIKMGEKGGFAVYGDELSKAEKFKHDPEGSLYETDLTAVELEAKIQNLGEAREFFIKFLEKPIFSLTITPETTLEDLKDELSDYENGGLTEILVQLFNYGFDFDVTLFDLPEEIMELIKKETRILNHLKHKTS